MKIERKYKTPSAIYIGSMADISFLLVIFFIVTSVIVAARGLDLNFQEPPPDENAVVDPEEAIDVHVQADGRLVVDGKNMALAELLPYIQPKIEQAPDKPVIVRTDPDARYIFMVVVLDQLRQAPETAGFEITNLIIPTRSEIERDWFDAGWSDG